MLLYHFMSFQRSLVEHHVWLRTNNARQLKSYAEFVSQRWPSVPGAKGSGLTGEESDTEEGDEKLLELDSVALLEGFDTSAAALLLEEEMRQSVSAVQVSPQYHESP